MEREGWSPSGEPPQSRCRRAFGISKVAVIRPMSDTRHVVGVDVRRPVIRMGGPGGAGQKAARRVDRAEEAGRSASWAGKRPVPLGGRVVGSARATGQSGVLDPVAVLE